MVATARSSRSFTPRKNVAATAMAIPQFKKVTRPNASILSFFQKTQRPEDSLRVGATPDAATHDEHTYSRDDEHRLNESTLANKKRRLSDEALASGENGSAISVVVHTNEPADNGKAIKSANSRHDLPFIVDSDGEDEHDSCDKDDGSDKNGVSSRVSLQPGKSQQDTHTLPSPGRPKPPDGPDVRCQSPEKKLGSNRQGQTHHLFTGLEGLGELDDLEFAEFEGEEMREMRFMHEQARLEALEDGTSIPEDFGLDPLQDDSAAQSCPICSARLHGVSVDEATKHVNSCLDGHPTPLSEDKPPKAASPPPEVEATVISKRFARAAIPRPGQANPLEPDNDGNGTKSAFSKLMSNKAEDSAWAAAAAAENASRGRPAYERTCPFYKIIPGFNICVDAFRYGAVKGCEAYFLSHFHSDHYIGLTASWVHGPIYCSKVTGSLVKQQLRTAAKWVVELDFEKPYDIPGTGGATVVMIPANHCPGSSLFLFEKPAERGSNRRGKRILHCGDFRACPAHVTHPLMKPDLRDATTGKLSQQIIDICYLDTTYLDPRYSFPPQRDVIKACADLCASLSPDPTCKEDFWEKGGREEDTQAVSKYFQSNKQSNDFTETKAPAKLGQRLLVVCGTYSIGKERICVAIANALNSKIFAAPGKMKICNQLGDPELTRLLTSNPVEAQVHMQPLMEIRAETLQEYLDGYSGHFSRIVGFRPSGWTYRPPSSKQISVNTSPTSIQTQQILHGKGWRSRFGYKDFVAQRGSTKLAMCFGVPYSEHSSFRELAMFIMSLRIEKVIPTVNVGSEKSRRRMKAWLDRWASERRRGGLVCPLVEGEDDTQDKDICLWEDKSDTYSSGSNEPIQCITYLTLNAVAVVVTKSAITLAGVPAAKPNRNVDPPFPPPVSVGSLSSHTCSLSLGLLSSGLWRAVSEYAVTGPQPTEADGLTSPRRILQQLRVHRPSGQMDIAHHRASNKHVLDRALDLRQSSTTRARLLPLDWASNGQREKGSGAKPHTAHTSRGGRMGRRTR
ncbi:DNA repair metallo-beta-lactamase [Metarhizium album ARSEF 1941]|uniref:DNA repair metallo-beta-lactamase n=1 Tax=Metarhizium album (strain ARSEF 1941) TaxID=1081103 RepID=A0A0B2WK92_METAS|nr:DNA repair metallo-beta-lactamase [Metarhizium album ARSEF 1941]KHN96476.1 DNA repair metallo-beta-lactamase [Metarhizium album ARSEF 1941]